MGSFVRRVQALALSLGAPGLFLVAFLDSSFLSLPEIADLLVIWMVVRRKTFLLVYVGAATLGSVAGCLVLYYLARKGGEAFVRKRFSGAAVEKTLASFRRHGVMAVLIPSVLPPPAPFKIFILLAGVVGISATRLAIAIALGRGIRYLALGILAVNYGDRAMAYMRDNGTAVSLEALGVLIVGFGIYLAWSKARAGKGR